MAAAYQPDIVRLVLPEDGFEDIIDPGTGGIDHGTGLKDSPICLRCADPFLIHLDRGGFGVDEKPGVAALGETLGGFMAGQPAVPLPEGGCQNRGRDKRKAFENFLALQVFRVGHSEFVLLGDVFFEIVDRFSVIGEKQIALLFDRNIVTRYPDDFIKVLKHLDHPQIPAYLDFFTIESERDVEIYLVQEYVEGKSLAQLVQEGKHFHETECLRIARELLRSSY